MGKKTTRMKRSSSSQWYGCTQLYKQPTIKYILVATKLACEQAFGRAFPCYFFPQTESLFTGYNQARCRSTFCHA